MMSSSIAGYDCLGPAGKEGGCVCVFVCVCVCACLCEERLHVKNLHVCEREVHKFIINIHCLFV